MPSLNAKDRVPLCLFHYDDGRRCRTPRISSHPHFCFYHAQKESQSQATEKLADDLAYFFSGKYLTANDLNAAMARLIPATIRGEIKPRLSRTVAYMCQMLIQSLHLSQREYANAFGTERWRQSIRNSVQNNHDHLYPKPPNPAEPNAASAAASPTPVGAGLVYPEPQRVRSVSAGSPALSPSPEACHPACPEGRREERTERREAPRQDLATPTIDETYHATTTLPTSATQAARNIARNLFPERPNTNPAPPPPTAPLTANLATPPTPLQTNPTPPPQAPTPRRQQLGAPDREAHIVHFGPECRLYVDGKPW